MADSRAERKAQNEVLFRAVNEKIRELGDSFDVLGEGVDPISCVCECVLPDCFERIPVPWDEYEAVRAEPERFVVAPGHEDLSVEVVVGEADGYRVVEKTEAGEVASSQDPRS